MGLIAAVIAGGIGLALGINIALGFASRAKSKDSQNSFFGTFIFTAFLAVPAASVIAFFGIFLWAKTGFKTFSLPTTDHLFPHLRGPFKTEYDNGQIKVQTDFTTYKTGTAIGYYSNGQKAFNRFYYYGEFDNSLDQYYLSHREPLERTFSWREWYFNGQIKAERVDAQSTGYSITHTVTQWYSNGQKQSEGIYAMDRKGMPRLGIHKAWYENGQQACEVEYPGNKGSTADKKYWKMKYWTVEGKPLGENIPNDLSYKVSIFYSPDGVADIRPFTMMKSECNLLDVNHIVGRMAGELERW